VGAAEPLAFGAASGASFAATRLSLSLARLAWPSERNAGVASTRLKPNAMNTASRTLPLGTRVQVTNEDFGQPVKVRINDRGPYAKGRVLDLTPKAARDIGIDRDDGLLR
jgi:hypothetical protein